MALIAVLSCRLSGLNQRNNKLGTRLLHRRFAIAATAVRRVERAARHIELRSANSYKTEIGKNR
jgi:hypothetical protein